MLCFNQISKWFLQNKWISKTRFTFIETKFLIISQTTKKIIYLFRLMKSLIIHLSKFLFIKCDNMRIIWLLIVEFFKLQTKFRHVNIHSHWLWQKVQWGFIHLNWMFIKLMIVNNFIKTFTFINFNAFVKMIGFKNKTQLFFNIQRKTLSSMHLLKKITLKFLKHLNSNLQNIETSKNNFCDQLKIIKN